MLIGADNDGQMGLWRRQMLASARRWVLAADGRLAANAAECRLADDDDDGSVSVTWQTAQPGLAGAKADGLGPG